VPRATCHPCPRTCVTLVPGLYTRRGPGGGVETTPVDPSTPATPVSDRVTSPINLEAKLKLFSDHWSPKIVTSFNGHDVMVVKVKGEFVWHSHPDTDDFFLVLKGYLTIRLRDGDVHLGPGDLYVVPKGVEHCPIAVDEAHLLLIEPAGTPNTGNAATAATKEVL
jgi:mannose-6-phosphate isomerase-like protein (cupin superfamily)